MTKLVIGLAAFVLLAAGGALAGGALTGSTDNAGFTTSTTNDSTTLGTSVEDRPTTGATTTAETGEDLSGPCDEAEHANDPECTGVVPAAPRGDDDDRAEDDRRHEDHSGPNRGSDDDDHGENEDRSGSNSGHGGGHDDD